MEMPDTPTTMPTLLLCDLCDKPFTREHQYKRHVAYCRKSQGRKRPRSCRACNQAKIRCNSCAPCNQCIRKGIICLFDYPQSCRQRQDEDRGKGLEIAVATESDPVLGIATPATPPDVESTLSTQSTCGLDCNLGNDDIFSETNEIEENGLTASPDLSHLRYSSNKVEVDLTESMRSNSSCDIRSFSTTSAAVTTTLEEENRFMTLFNDTFMNTESIFANINFQLDDASYNYNGKELLPIYSPNLPKVIMEATTKGTSSSSEITIRGHFTKNNVKAGIQQICATIIIDMIHAYPRMMTRRETLPPLIHAHSYAEDTDNDANKPPEQLTNCMGIAQLFTGRTVDTHPFVWATIRAEMRGFRHRLRRFDKYDALSALQASLLYAIMRAADSPQEASDDFEMLLIYDARS